MPRRVCQVIVVVVMLGTVVTGCALQRFLFPVEDAETYVKQAREDFQAVQELKVQEKYPKDFKEAEQKLQVAEQDLGKLNDLLRSKIFPRQEVKNLSDTIKDNAQQSRAASQNILRQYYLETVVPMIQKAEKNLDTVISNDTDHPLNQYQAVLDDLTRKSNAVSSGQKTLSLKEVIDDINMLIQTEAMIGSTTQAVIGADDIAFNIGEYQLTPESQTLLAKLAQQILAARQQIAAQYPDKKVIIQLNALGYADEADFRSESLLQVLTKDDTVDVPDDPIKRRQFLNQRLSTLRAQATSAYLKQELLKVPPNIRIQSETIGKGETLPANLKPPFPTSDQRRRICKIYSYVIVQ